MPLALGGDCDPALMAAWSAVFSYVARVRGVVDVEERRWGARRVWRAERGPGGLISAVDAYVLSDETLRRNGL